MSETPERITIDYSLEELRCSLCKTYLSCAPILMLADGNSICGNCSVAGEGQTYRNLKLEAVLTNTAFPCQHKKNGCPARPVFGHVKEHEAECLYQTRGCFHSDCAWKGSRSALIRDHFASAHPEMVGENAEIMIKLHEDTRGGRIVHVNNDTFLLTFNYTATSSNLRYKLICTTRSKVQEPSHKIKLINDIDHDYCVTLKGGHPHHSDTGIVLNNAITYLNNPSLLKVKIEFFGNLGKNNNNLHSPIRGVRNHSDLITLPLHRKKFRRDYSYTSFIDSWIESRKQRMKRLRY